MIEQLADDGRMVLPLRGPVNDAQELIKVMKSPGGLIKESLYGVRFVHMQGEVEG